MKGLIPIPKHRQGFCKECKRSLFYGSVYGGIHSECRETNRIKLERTERVWEKRLANIPLEAEVEE